MSPVQHALRRAALGSLALVSMLPLPAAAQPPPPPPPAAAPTAVPRRAVSAPVPAGTPAAPDRGWIGVSLDRDPPPTAPPADDESAPVAAASDASAAPPAGIRIGAVIRGSPADRAGLRGGDLVTTIDGQPIESTQEFIQSISTRGPGAWLDLEVWRRGSTRRVTVRLERFPDDAARLRDVKLGWAGIEALDVPLQLREQWGGSEERGVLVGAVVELGPADRAGVRPGDLVLEVDGEPVAAVPQMVQRIARVGDGAKVELALSRQGLSLTVEVLLEIEPPDEAESGPPRRNPAEGPARRPNGR